MYVRVVLRAFIELVDGFVWDIHATSMRAAIALMATRRSRNTTASISIRIGHTHCCAPRLGVITHELHCHTDAARRAHPLPAVFGIVCQCARVLIRRISAADDGTDICYVQQALLCQNLRHALRRPNVSCVHVSSKVHDLNFHRFNKN